MKSPPCLLLFTKPARPGRVKTRLVGARVGERTLGERDAAALHAALLGDVAARLGEAAGEAFRVRVAWDLAPGEALPPLPAELAGRAVVDATRQRGRDLGERLFRAFDEAARDHPVVAAVGSDHPKLSLAAVRRAFAALAAGEGDVALGPSLDGGYYLVAVRRESLSPRLFAEIDWSTERVLAQTRERCRELGLSVVELPAARDVDRGEDVIALAGEIAAAEAAGEAVGCPRTRQVLAGWGLLPPRAAAEDQPTQPHEGRRACAS
jgi:uncharacterized protein